VLRPAEALELAQLVRTFTLRTSEGFVENFGPACSRASAPRRPACGCASCRSPTRTARRCATARRPGDRRGRQCDGPELRAQALFRDRFVGVVRSGHPLCRGEHHPGPLCGGRHIGILAAGPRNGADRRSPDRRSAWSGIVTIVGGFSAALALARASDLIASVPERHTGNLRAGMHSFPLAGRPRRSSRCPCSGTRGWMPIRRTGGCVGWYCVRGEAEIDCYVWCKETRATVWRVILIACGGSTAEVRKCLFAHLAPQRDA
jgi:hypothetical protein